MSSIPLEDLRQGVIGAFGGHMEREELQHSNKLYI